MSPNKNDQPRYSSVIPYSTIILCPQSCDHYDKYKINKLLSADFVFSTQFEIRVLHLFAMVFGEIGLSGINQ